MAANALIESMRRAEKNFLTYREIENYGSKVVQILNDQGEKAVLILSRENTNELFRNYSDFLKKRKKTKRRESP